MKKSSKWSCKIYAAQSNIIMGFMQKDVLPADITIDDNLIGNLPASRELIGITCEFRDLSSCDEIIVDFINFSAEKNQVAT
jgi:hypothetical protein